MSRKLQGFRPRTVIFFLLLGLIPPIVGHVILVASARESVSQQMQNQAGKRAADIQREVANLIEGAVLQVSNLANSSTVEEAALRADQARPSPEQLEEQVVEIESRWPQLRSDAGLLREILENPTSQFLRRQNEVHATFREILVTDEVGRLIAATNKTSDYFQADEKWWQRAYLQGSGAGYVGDLVFDESANSYGIEVAEPIRDDESGAVIGIIKGILDSPALFSTLQEANIGEHEQVLLVRPDGTVVWSPKALLKYPYDAELRAAIADGERSFTFSEGESDVLVGMPPAGVNARIPELDWYVLVELDRQSALAPLSGLNSSFFLIVAATVTVILLLAAAFTRMLSKPVVEIDPHFERIA